jgi:hypothetical protein
MRGRGSSLGLGWSICKIGVHHIDVFLQTTLPWMARIVYEVII